MSSYRRYSKPYGPCHCCGGSTTGRNSPESRYCYPCCLFVGTSIHAPTQRATRAAVNAGVLPHPSTLTCEDCGGPAVLYDHRDYTQPLQVAAVCHGCNLKRGPGKLPNNAPDLVAEAVARAARRGFRIRGVKRPELASHPDAPPGGSKREVEAA